jgi:hypothetical protein
MGPILNKRLFGIELLKAIRNAYFYTKPSMFIEICNTEKHTIFDFPQEVI